MNLINAFLIVSIVSYVLCLILPKSTIKNLDIKVDKALNLLSAVLLIAGILVAHPYLWFTLSIIWVGYAGASFLGYFKWNVLWKDAASDTAQIGMFAWDLLIAYACMIKV